MTTINSLSNSTVYLYETDGEIKQITDIINELDEEKKNDWGMRFMYNDWMQKVLLSDGLDPDENHDW
ncbi:MULTISPECIES: hypothetical protein [unclassified Symbiopectobacterium]|uniref:hypothetical protein n=1 Tax=unclassified Symbiopectobacterium TaxID=2794573 RepID=UPI002225CBBC|nr:MULTISPECIES: hypothetical protein [unclassified Symbiopectobacterium]MCW2477104.1 hypothetical protein [Candidatus Symbiopectobacterium sp. NZEC151]MCW2488550.1 hypothetical protein [Candidatus Symbiopectobacterium sp. NZEC127]